MKSVPIAGSPSLTGGDTSISESNNVKLFYSMFAGDVKITSNDKVFVKYNGFSLEDVGISKNTRVLRGAVLGPRVAKA